MFEVNKVDILDELHQNFIDFAYEANSQRAFADARDGLKPGQRACLWEMYTKGYASNKPHVKSAKISGGVIATWWTHGDVAVYETFARMSQPWINNIPEIDWHGANGNVIVGPAPANQRYTEARLSKATEEGMLQGLKKNNVPMIENFSEDEEWPSVLPAIMPRLMVNGCQGIGVTIANTWIPHNLKEISDVIVKYMKTKELDTKSIYPDFPSGGVITNSKDIHAMYETGKGKVVLRGLSDIKGNSILISALPYQVYVEPFIDSIKKLIETDEITGIRDIYNKSDKKHLLIEIECDGNPSKVLNTLYKLTDLQKSYSANQYALVGKTPKLLTLKDYIEIYSAHNKECVRKEYEFDLTKAKKRLEIVDGLLKALEDIDNIIALIKKSNSSADAVMNLIKTYSFTDNQAKAIVDMKLGRLAHLEKIELNEEKTKLIETIEECELIIGHEDKQAEIVISRLESFTKKYGSDRKTELTHIDVKPEEKEIAEVIPEDVVIIAAKSGLIKKIPLTSFKIQRKGGKGIKSQDEAILDIIKTNTVDTLMFFTTKGKMYRLIADNVPTGTNATKGTLIESLIKLEDDEKVIAVTSLHRKTTPKYVIFVTKQGMVKKSYLEEYTKTNRNTGISALNVKDGDEVVDIIFQDEEDMVIITKNGMSIRFETSNIAAIGRIATGVKGIKLNEDDCVIAALPVHKETDNVAVFSENGMGKQVKLSEFPVQARGGKGTYVYKTDMLAGAAMVSDEDNILICGNYSSICIPAHDISVQSKIGSGVTLIRNNRVISIAKI